MIPFSHLNIFHIYLDGIAITVFLLPHALS